MNRCTHLDEILHAHVPRQPLETYWVSRSSVKGQGHMLFVFLCAWCCGYLRTVVSLEQGLMILLLLLLLSAKSTQSTMNKTASRMSAFCLCSVNASASSTWSRSQSEANTAACSGISSHNDDYEDQDDDDW